VICKEIKQSEAFVVNNRRKHLVEKITSSRHNTSPQNGEELQVGVVVIVV